jgi:carbon monoxide dehydrogenase subunit G
MDKRHSTLIFAASGMFVLGIGVATYLKWIRPWHLRWGATDDEVNRSLPGDDRIPAATWCTTRAVTIAAPPAAVWPWLVQMGYRRAGWYSYDRFDNDGIVVKRIIPELQHLAVGDMMLTDSTGGFRVEAIEPERSIVMMIHGAATGMDADISSTLVLNPIDDHRTRLILRARADFRGWREKLWGWLLFDAGDFVMMRKMLLGIKARAEREYAM